MNIRSSFYWVVLLAYLQLGCGKQSTADVKKDGDQHEVPAPDPNAGTIEAKLTTKTDLIKKVNSYAETVLADGVKMYQLKYTSKSNLPMVLFLFEANLKNPNVTLKALMPNGGTAYGRQSVPLMVTKNTFDGYKIIGATNGDFFDSTTGEPRGIVYINGTAIRTTIQPGWAFFAIDKTGKPLIGNSTTYLQHYSNLQYALGGRQVLVTKGQKASQPDFTIAPRTGIGYTEEDKVYIMVVDGRSENYSNGMTFEEMGQVMYALGVKEAINIDGGGSSTFVTNTETIQVLNKPSDGTPREVANGWAICIKK